MGLLKTLFGGTGEIKIKKNLPWKTLHSIELFDEIMEASKVKPQLIFKYSTRCGVSRIVLNQFEDNYDLSKEDMDLYFLDLIQYRKVSNEVAYTFQVQHESPQVLIIKNGVVVDHRSHGGVNSINLNRLLK